MSAAAPPLPWLTIRRGEAPLLVSIPHTGTDLVGLEPRLVSPWLARKDADWWIDRLYDFAADLGATVIHTAVSRTVVDVNRDPSGLSLYPGQATTELCPTTTFDGEPLYQPGQEPKPAEIDARRRRYFDPYHDALRAEADRLRERHATVVVYDCHSIRSVVPRLFEGALPHCNLGTNAGASCAPALTAAVEAVLDADGAGFTRVTDGRFKGGSITRSFGDPAAGIHAIQMELACRGYMLEPAGPPAPDSWPTPYDPDLSAPMRSVLRRVLGAALSFTERSEESRR